MKIDYDIAEKIKKRFVEREDALHDIYNTETKTTFPDDVFEFNGIRITLRTGLKLLTLTGGKSPEDYTTTFILRMNGGPRITIRDPWCIGTTAAWLGVYDDRKRLVFEIPIKED